MLSFQSFAYINVRSSFLPWRLRSSATCPQGTQSSPISYFVLHNRSHETSPRAQVGVRRWIMDQARVYTHARGSAMEAAAALDTMRVMKLVADTTYARGMELL